LLVYMNSTPGITCEEAANHLGRAPEPADPSGLYTPETCNLVFQFLNPPSDVSVDRPIDAGDGTKVVVSAACIAGPGIWERRTISGQDDYFWVDADAGDGEDAIWYTAYADAGQITRLEGSGGDRAIDVEIDGFDGSYPLDGTASVARGQGSGTITSSSCDLFAETPFFY